MAGRRRPPPFCRSSRGLVVLLLKSMTSLRQLYAMSMDAHARFRTEAHVEVTPRFNERFILSLASCASCLVVDDELNVLPISSHIKGIRPVRKGEGEDEDEAMAEGPGGREVEKLQKSYNSARKSSAKITQQCSVNVWNLYVI